MSARLIVFVIATACGLDLSSSLRATPLIFDRPSIEVELPPDSQEGRAVFPFKNASSSSVRVLEVKTECDCVQASVAPPVVEAGQKSEITLKFQSKLRNGTDLVRATVVADNGETYAISANVKLRSYIEARPLVLHWRKGETRGAKDFLVSSTELARLQFTKVAAVKNSKVEVLRSEDAASIRVRVTPAPTAGPFQDILVVSALVEETGATMIYDLHLKGE